PVASCFVWGCMGRCPFGGVVDCIARYTVNLLLQERQESETLAATLEEGLTNASDGIEINTISATTGASTHAVVDQSFILLSAWQVTQRWKKTPKTLRLKGVKLPSYQQKGAYNVYYPFKNPEQPYKILRLQLRLSASASSDQKGYRPAAFADQIPVVLKGVHRLGMTDSETGGLNRLPSLQDLDRRLGVSKAVGSGDELPDAPAADLPAGGGASDDGFAEGEEEDGAPLRIRQRGCSPSGVKQEACDQAVFELPSLRPAADDDGQVDPNIKKGTADYWIAKLPIRQVAAGKRLGSEYNQAKLLHNKLPVGDDRNRLAAHMKLYDRAMQFVPGSMEKLSDQDFQESCQVFESSGLHFLLVTHMEILRRKTQPCWDEFEKAPREVHGQHCLRRALGMLQLWQQKDGSEFQWANPRLIDMDLVTPELTEAFQNLVFGDHLVKWIGAGEEKEPLVLEFAHAVIEAWELPTDAHIADEAAQVLVDAQRAVGVLRYISDQNISHNTDIALFDDVKAMEQARLMTAARKNDQMKTHAPKVSQFLRDFQKHEAPTPTKAFLALAKSAVGELPFLRAALAPGAADELESVAMNKLAHAVQHWTRGGAGQPKGGAISEGELELMSAYKALLAEAADSRPSFENLMQDMRDIGKIIGDADSRAKVHAVKKVITKANAGESIDAKELLDMAQGIDSDALAEADHAEMAGYFASHVKMLAERDFTPASNRSPTDSSLEVEGVLVGFMRKDLSKKAEVVLSTSRALMKLQRETAMLNVTVVDDCDGDSGSTSEKQASAVKRELAKVTKMLKMKFDDEVISSGEVASIFQDRATSIVDVSTGLCMRVTQACLKRREFVLAGARLKAQSLSVDNSDLMGWVERDKLTWEDLKAKAQELLDGASVDGIFNALGNIEQ
ncbi:unnamed protein product, partial [Prorocentrum cordatum]